MTKNEYKRGIRKGKDYAKSEGLKLVRITYGYLNKTTKVPVLIFSHGCQIQIRPDGSIMIVDMWR